MLQTILITIFFSLFCCCTLFKNFVPPDKTIGNFLRKYKLMPKIYDKLSKKINKA